MSSATVHKIRSALKALTIAAKDLRQSVEETAASRAALHAIGKQCWIDQYR